MKKCEKANIAPLTPDNDKTSDHLKALFNLFGDWVTYKTPYSDKKI